MAESNPVEVAFAEAQRLHIAKEFDRAEPRYRSILESDPKHVGTLSNLGSILSKRGNNAEAEELFNRALAIEPGSSQALFNLGNLHRRAEKFDLAADYFRACIRIAPELSAAHYNLGICANAVGLLDEAEASFFRATKLEKSVGDAYLHHGHLLLRLGRADEAVEQFRKYHQANPGDPRGHYNLALTLANDGRPADAVDLLYKAIALRPDYPEAHNALGLSLELLGRKDDAAHHFELAVQANPDLADAWNNLGVMLADQGRADDAIAAFRQSLSVEPNAAGIFSNLLLQMNNSSSYTPDKLRDEHKSWAAKYAPTVPPAPEPLPPHDATRKLRIGYVSADFRSVPSSQLIRTFLKDHDREQFEVFAYSNTQRSDDVTEQLRGLADHWRSIVGLPSDRVAEQIDRDRIDVLVDLSGHMAGNRLHAFAHRPAALQVTLAGYRNTTGVAAIDFRITDSISDPPGATEPLYTEKLIRLPDVPWVYSPPFDAPDVGPLPALSKRTFTFGCLNAPAKISDSCLNTWIHLLQSTPGSRLVLLAGQSQVGLKRLADRFAKGGILRERVQLFDRLPVDRYFALYSEIDIALDPYPSNGGRTTCDALWMGVPSLTIAGWNFASRQGAMINFQVGLGDWIVSSPAELQPLAKSWLNRRPELAKLRSELRGRLATSALCDGPRFMRNFERALRTVWADRLPAPAATSPEESPAAE